MLHPLTTQIVGSYAKPRWLASHEKVHALDGSWWRPEAEVLDEAKQDAALLAIYDQERAGLDVVTDGEAQRVAYDRHFMSSLSGIDMNDVARQAYVSEVETRARRSDIDEMMEGFSLSPRIVGPLAWTKPSAADDLAFLKAHASRPVKVNVVGPMTLLDRLSDEHYGDPEAAVMALADVLNAEIRALEALKPAIIQVDEPAFHFKLSRARTFGPQALARVVAGVTTPIVVHACYGYSLYAADKKANPSYAEVVSLLAQSPIAGMSIEYEQPGHEPDLLRHAGDKHILLGLLNLGTQEIETPEQIAARLRAALDVVPAERLHPCSDCGMWFLPRRVAFGKISALVAGTNIVCRELGLPERPAFGTSAATL
jgi:5-methyltetrahydropteroyltriglutamate--homocysteine methyltransferase